MSIRLLPAALAAGLLTCALAMLAPTTGSAQTILPEGGSKQIILTGCFLQQTVTEKGKAEQEYVLARPIMGSIESVPEATCTSSDNDQVVELEHVKDHPSEHHLDSSKLGRWIEVFGELERSEGPDELREMNVKSFHQVPVVPPQAAEAAPEPQPTIAENTPPPPVIRPIEPAAPQAVGTTGELPKTASNEPWFGFVGLMALFAASLLRLFEKRRTVTIGRE